ncbi:MAG TPA: hypothetical protein VFH66_06665 [Mycobacteriales bacterium]|nr:hypothetical protein [Mycobacteriales bacterium]
MTETPIVTWHAFDLKSGRRGPQMTTQQMGAFGRIIGDVTDCNLQIRCYDSERDSGDGLPTIDYATPGWDAGTAPGRALLVALDEDEIPLWGGLVLTRPSDGTEWVEVDLVTLEHYFGRRYVGYLDFFGDSGEGVDQASIAQQLIEPTLPDGLPFTFDAPLSGTLRQMSYSDDEDKTVLAALQELMALEGGPEFTVDLEWTDDTHTALSYVVRVRNRLGVAPTVPVQFTMPGCVTAFTFTEDYSEENGANDVLATSSGQGEGRPTSAHHVASDAIAGGWPKYELRFQPAASVLDDGLLDAAAEEELALTTYGLQEFTLTSTLADAPRVAVDWRLGDDITVQVTSARFPAYIGPDGDLVAGFVGRGRVVGWDADFDAGTIAPKVRV